MKPNVLISLVGVGGLVVGGVAGYLVGANLLKKKFLEDLGNEVQKVRSYYKQNYTYKIESVSVNKYEDEQPSPEINEKPRAVELSPTYEELYPEETTDYPSAVVDNPKDEAPQRLDPNSEDYRNFIANRDTNKPYIITVYEFMEDNIEYEKQSLVYYKGDDTLSDHREQCVPDHEETVGEENLTKFGLYSDDHSVVYIRNDRLSVDYEIVYDERCFVDVVVGYEYRQVEEIDEKVFDEKREKSKYRN